MHILLILFLIIVETKLNYVPNLKQKRYKEELSDDLYKKNSHHIVDQTDKDEPMHINLLTKEYSSPNKIIYFNNADTLQEETLENKEMALANMLNPNVNLDEEIAPHSTIRKRRKIPVDYQITKSQKYRQNKRK